MLILLNKPYDVLCQFTDGAGRQTLADFVAFKGVYPAGRLDRDSEGLVVLTDDGGLQARITNPMHKLEKVYLAQVEGVVGDKALGRRTPPIRVRKSVPDGWIELTLREGRNRQVRRMCAAVGLPCLRLIRWQVGEWTLDGLAPGEWRER